MRTASLVIASGALTLPSAAVSEAARTGPHLTNLSELVTSDDYPSAALRDGHEGQVRVSVRVRRDGLVESCKVIKSSGHPSLDEQSCALFRARARFEPARDRSGRATAGTYENTMRWVIPDKEVPLAPRQAWVMRIFLTVSENKIVGCRSESVGLPGDTNACPPKPLEAKEEEAAPIIGEMISVTQFIPTPFAATTIPADIVGAERLGRQISELTIDQDGIVSRCVGMRYDGLATPEHDTCKDTNRGLMFEAGPKGAGPLTGTLIVTAYAKRRTVT